ncbi:MAG: DUF2007 domain-containing protein [Maricaulaceae bacterium]
MICIIRTNDPVTISFAQAVLKDSQIESFVMDQHMSLMEGSVGAIPRRLMVIDADEFAARRALTLAGLEDELVKPS